MTTLANGTICKLGLTLEADAQLQWGAALAAAAEEYGITDPHVQAVWLANVMDDTHGLTHIIARLTYSLVNSECCEALGLSPEDSVSDIYRVARACAWLYQRGGLRSDAPSVKEWHRRVYLAMGL